MNRSCESKQQPRGERHLQRAHEALDMASRMAGMGAWEEDLPAGELSFTDHWSQMLGYDASEVPRSRESLEALTHPDDLPKFRDAIQRLVEKPSTSSEVEVRFRGKSGEWHHLLTRARLLEESAGQSSRLVVTQVDVTERRRIEAALRDSQQRYLSVLDNIGEVVFQIDAEGRWTMLNNAWEQVTGFSVAQTLGRKFVDSIHSADAPSVQDLLARLISGQIPETQIECRLLSAKEEPRWAEVRVRGAGGGDDHRVAATGSIQDVTARKLASDQIAGALRREQQLNRLRNEFITTASHEFRTPLAGIMHSAETLKDYGEDLKPEQRLRYADIILRGAKRIDTLIDEVLILGKAQAGRLVFRPQNLALQDFVRRCVAELPIKIEHQGRIGLELKLPKETYCMDGVLLRHTLVNLLTNALKYSPPDAPVSLEVVDEGQTAVTFRIRDRGIGIPPEDMPHLFDPFHRGSNVGSIKGSGVGLSITKSCVECQGGSISCESVVGSGTTFRVCLPFQPTRATDMTPPATSPGIVFR